VSVSLEIIDCQKLKMSPRKVNTKFAEGTIVVSNRKTAFIGCQGVVTGCVNVSGKNMYNVTWHDANGKEFTSVQLPGELKEKAEEEDDENNGEGPPRKVRKRCREVVDSDDDNNMAEESDEMPAQAVEGLENVGPDE